MKTFMIIFFFGLLSSCGDSQHTINESFRDDLFLLQNEHQLPGLGVGILQDDELETSITGKKRIESEDLLSDSDSFHLGSCTKAMTATLAAILIDEGLFHWSTKINELLPDVEFHGDFGNATFEMLLSHRMDLIHDGPQTFSGDWLFKALQSPLFNASEARKLYAKTILALKPQRLPGSTFIYQNGNYVIAAHILEELTGQSWETLIKDKIFTPLRMNSCGTGPTWGHYKDSISVHSIFADNPQALAPAAGVHCNLRDWMKFLRIHLKGFNGEEDFLSKESFSKLHTVAADDGHQYTYGGWIKVYEDWANGFVLTHNGSNTWNYAQVWIIPNHNGIIGIATNIAGDKAIKATQELLRLSLNQLH